jgi:hypothetical protein
VISPTLLPSVPRIELTPVPDSQSMIARMAVTTRQGLTDSELRTNVLFMKGNEAYGFP